MKERSTSIVCSGNSAFELLILAETESPQLRESRFQDGDCTDYLLKSREKEERMQESVRRHRRSLNCEK